MPHRSVLHRFANLFMNKTGDNYAGLETSSHSTLSLVWNKPFSVNQKTAKPAMASKLEDAVTISTADGADYRPSLSNYSEEELCSSTDIYKPARNWRKRLKDLLLRNSVSCGTFAFTLPDVELALYRTVVSPNGEKSSKRVFVLFSTMPERAKRELWS
ncbi:hypothetical protein HZ326_28344 [Fusarium oxysporum f. sp. albedinis]|nr:hypothetical protein HZ326_28344 [Fusarium oxysporum f. sp. albedinis]